MSLSRGCALLASKLGRVNRRAESMERRLELPLFLAALLTIPTIAIEQSEAGHAWDVAAAAMNWLTWSAFLLEFVLMMRVVEDRWAWIKSHPLDVAILVFTPPFLPATLQAARAFRLLRLLRLVRGAVIARRLLSTEGVRDAAILAVLTVLGGGAAFAAVESEQGMSAWDGVWWAITTVTTVGYGDYAPTTTAGRILAMGVMFVGIGFVAILTAAAAERFIRSRREDQRELREEIASLHARLDAIERAISSR